jgi:hypothetical protein
MEAIVADSRVEAKWSERVEASHLRREEARAAFEAADNEFRKNVRGAFDAGLSVTPLVTITGLTPSRLYQIKGGRRT